MKKYNTLITQDEESGAIYLYMPNLHPKNNPPVIKKTAQIETDLGIICIDISPENKIVGIEITDGSLVSLPQSNNYDKR